MMVDNQPKTTTSLHIVFVSVTIIVYTRVQVQGHYSCLAASLHLMGAELHCTAFLYLLGFVPRLLIAGSNPIQIALIYTHVHVAMYIVYGNIYTIKQCTVPGWSYFMLAVV